MTYAAGTVIDVHHHYWWLGKRSHRWPAAARNALDRSFTPEDLRPRMQAASVDAGLLVQSLNDDAETREFLELATASPRIAGVVGWVPLGDPVATARHLDDLPHRELLVGIRHLINFEPDSRWLLQPGVMQSIGELDRRGLVFDSVPVDAVQFDAVLEVARRYPSMPVVLDHLARPPVGKPEQQAWRDRIRQAAQRPNVSIKLSVGLDVLLGWAWSVAQLRPHAETVLEHFGPDRVMAASNWPVCNLAAGYETVWSGLRELISPLPATAQAAILGGNAVRIFRLDKQHVPL